MNFRALTRDIPLHLRATSIAAEIRLRLQARKLLTMAFAVAVAVIALVMVNIAAFRALETLWGPIWTPLLLGLGNIAVAAVLLIWAAFMHADRDLVLAEDMRKATFAAIENDLRSGTDGFGALPGAEVARLAMPILTTIIGAMRHSRNSAPK